MPKFGRIYSHCGAKKLPQALFVARALTTRFRQQTKT